MPRRVSRWCWPLAAGLAVIALGCSIRHGATPHYNAVPYDRILSKYLHGDGETQDRSYEVDVWALWQELGIPPGSMQEPGSRDLRDRWWALWHNPRSLSNSRHYAFYAEPGKRVQLECDCAALRDTKVIAITSTYQCTQVLVFRQRGSAEEDDFLFAYAFTTGLGGMADRSSVNLIEPESGLMLLAMSYRNDHGTGTHGYGRSIYRLDSASACCLLRAYGDGWCIQAERCGYGYSCDMGDWEQTWPKLDLTVFVEYVPGGQPDGLLDVYELNAHVSLLWDHQSRTFQPSPGNALPDDVVHAVVENPIRYLESKIGESPDQGLPDGIIATFRRPESDTLRGWGK